MDQIKPVQPVVENNPNSSLPNFSSTCYIPLYSSLTSALPQSTQDDWSKHTQFWNSICLCTSKRELVGLWVSLVNSSPFLTAVLKRDPTSIIHGAGWGLCFAWLGVINISAPVGVNILWSSCSLKALHTPAVFSVIYRCVTIESISASAITTRPEQLGQRWGVSFTLPHSHWHIQYVRAHKHTHTHAAMCLTHNSAISSPRGLLCVWR